MRRFALSSILMLLLAGPGFAEFPVYFADSRLKEAVEATLWIVDPEPADMLALTSLNANSRSVASLVGLETAHNLTSLEMTHNLVSDLTPLSGLPNLSKLVLNTNEISDLTPLSGITSLTHLNLHANHISDVSALSGLSNLQTLILRINQISDVSPLAGLTSLNSLNLEDNRISSISALAGLGALTEAHVGFNQISDLTPVRGLAHLSDLDVHNNNVSDISCLTSLTSLRRLDLRNNPLSQTAYDQYIPRIQANNPGIYIEYDSHAGRILRVSSTAGGSVIDPGEGDFTYDYGAYVRLEAKADSGFTFSGWSGNYSSSQNPLFITMTADVTIQATFACKLTEIYVDDDAPNDPGPANAEVGDPQENGTFEHPFDTIQEGLDVAAGGASIAVQPGIYRENIRFLGKKVYVIAVDPENLHGGPCATIEGAGIGPVVHIGPGGGNKCGLAGFVLTRGAGQSVGAIYCSGSSPTISDCLIAGNRCSDFDGAAVYFEDSQAVLTHCTIADNYAGQQGAGLTLIDSDIIMSDSILWGNTPQEVEKTSISKPVIQYCAVRGWWPDLGNIHADPLFAERGAWVNCDNPNKIVEPGDTQATWTEGDYHLKSQEGRWDSVARVWVADAVTSPCIDAGTPSEPVEYEPAPNGNRIDMGVYGGTNEASKSFSR
ncbi:MAG: leucine-rich repeat domain-containing protein [Solirubrobacterales bacterium]